MIFTPEELQVWSQYMEVYFLEVLNGEKTLAEAQEDLASFRNTKYYTGDDPKYKLATPTGENIV